MAQYTSTDLYNWNLEDPFYEDESVFMIECVDLFEMDGQWYFIYSNINDRKVHYRMSDSLYGPWETPAVSALDGVAYYAAKSASDGHERLLFGWCPTRIDDKDPNNYNWEVLWWPMPSLPMRRLVFRGILPRACPTFSKQTAWVL